MKKSSRVIVLINLGSPSKPTVMSIRFYLREFLMDPKVITVPWFFRFLIVYFLILPFRPYKTKKLYESIWTKKGSPLLVYGRALQKALAKKSRLPVTLGMRYGKPSIAKAIDEAMGLMNEQGELLIVPMYPQYAMSTTESVQEKTEAYLKKKYPTTNYCFLPPFYNQIDYIKLLAKKIKPYLKKSFDILLFTYHGIPEKHVLMRDITKKHCLQNRDVCCSSKSSKSHLYCYRAQANLITELTQKELKLSNAKVSMSFQSRLGSDPWLKPYSDFEYERLAKKGIKNIIVVSPSFVSDCLETLEEIAVEGKEIFIQAGGASFTYIPCLNADADWVELLAKWAQTPFSKITEVKYPS